MKNGRTPDRQMSPRVAAAGPHAGIGFREFVLLVAAMMAMMALAIDTMLPALPAIGGSLGVMDENERQWIVTAYLLGFGVAQLAYGPLSDRLGRRPLLLGGMVGYILCSLGVALSPSFAMLLAFRALQGVAIAATRVVTISVVRDCYGGRQMARVMSLALIVFLAVPVLAPSIGQIIMLVFPWRGLFGALAVYGVLVCAWTALRLPETLHPEYRRAIDPRTVLRAAAAALRSRQACGYMLAQVALQGALFGFINSVQQIFADVFHAPKLMPAVFAGIAGMMAISSLANARFVERFGTRRLSHGALIGFIAIECIHLGVALAGYETIVSFAVCQGLAMLAYGLTMGNFGAMAMEPVAEIAGTAASVQGFFTMVGGALIGFWIGQSFDGSAVPMVLGFALSGVAAMAIVLATEGGRLFVPRMGA